MKSYTTKRIFATAAAAGLPLLLSQCTIQDDIHRLNNQVRALNQKVETMRTGEAGELERRQASTANALGQMQDESLRMRSNMEESLAAMTAERQASDAKIAELNAKIAALETRIQNMNANMTRAQQAKVEEAERRAAEAARRAEEARQKATAANDAARAAAARTAGTPQIRDTSIAPAWNTAPQSSLAASEPSSVRQITDIGKTRVAAEDVAAQTAPQAAAQSRPAPAAPASAPQQQVAAPPVEEPTASAPPPPPPAEKPADASSSDPYSQGMSQFSGKQYKEAYKSFEKAYAANPGGANAADTLYHMGESLYNQGEYDLAILDYQKVISNHGASALASKALLKQGMAFEKLTDNETAKIIYRKLLNDYKQSPEAGQAQDRLNKL